MNMNRILIIWSALLLLAAGCDREPCVTCSELEIPRRHVQLELAGRTADTKVAALSPLEESQVVRCQLYVFNQTGYLVNCYSSTDGRFDFFLTDETYDFVAVANKGGLPTAAVTREALLGTATTLTENAPGNFVMVGCLDRHIIESDEKITIEMQRLVAKVSCVVRTAFSGELAALPFTVEAAYLTNVAGENRLSLADSLLADGARWYNRMDAQPETDDTAQLLYAGLGQSLRAADSLVCPHGFYAYPNASPDSHDKNQWGSRCTRFVLKATLGERSTYYPVTLPRVENNHHYHIDLTISNYGLEHPEDRPEDYAGFQLLVSVSDWADGDALLGDF